MHVCTRMYVYTHVHICTNTRMYIYIEHVHTYRLSLSLSLSHKHAHTHTENQWMTVKAVGSDRWSIFVACWAEWLTPPPAGVPDTRCPEEPVWGPSLHCRTSAPWWPWSCGPRSRLRGGERGQVSSGRRRGLTLNRSKVTTASDFNFQRVK